MAFNILRCHQKGWKEIEEGRDSSGVRGVKISSPNDGPPYEREARGTGGRVRGISNFQGMKVSQEKLIKNVDRAAMEMK